MLLSIPTIEYFTVKFPTVGNSIPHRAIQQWVAFLLHKNTGDVGRANPQSHSLDAN